MSQSFKILNIEALKKAPLHEKPYPYIIVDNLLDPAMHSAIAESFPKIKKRGSFPLSSVTYEEPFATLIKELRVPSLKS